MKWYRFWIKSSDGSLRCEEYPFKTQEEAEEYAASKTNDHESWSVFISFLVG